MGTSSVKDALLPLKLPAIAPGKAAEDGPDVCTTLPSEETQMKFQASGFGLVHPCLSWRLESEPVHLFLSVPLPVSL